MGPLAAKKKNICNGKKNEKTAKQLYTKITIANRSTCYVFIA
jgi:hypothetical protein